MSTKKWEDDFLNHLEDELGQISMEKPSSEGKQRFLDFIETEEVAKTKTFALRQWLPQIGVAAAVLLIFGTMMYNQHQQNNQLSDSLMAMNKKVEKLLQNDSPTERIKAITVSYGLGDDVNEKMLATLVEVLQNDESSNVRQTAVETLAFYINNENVRSALIKQLPKEEDAVVKLSIIQTIAMKKDDTSKNALESIVRSENEPFVVDEATMQLNGFKQY